MQLKLIYPSKFLVYALAVRAKKSCHHFLLLNFSLHTLIPTFTGRMSSKGRR